MQVSAREGRFSHLMQPLAPCDLENLDALLPGSKIGPCDEVLDTLRAHAALRLCFRRPFGHNAAMSLLAVLANCLI